MRFLQHLAAVVLLPLFLTGCPKDPDKASADGTMTSTECPDGSGGCASHTVFAPTHHSAVDLAGKAESGIFANATLEDMGSFGWDTAPVTNKAADILIAVPLALKKHEITKGEAQARVDAADKSHDLIVQAKRTCNQKHGKCTGNEAKARALLDQAKAQLAGL